MVIVLVGVAVVIGALLAFVNHLTEGPIALKAQNTLAVGIKKVMQSNSLKVADPIEEKAVVGVSRFDRGVVGRDGVVVVVVLNVFAGGESGLVDLHRAVEETVRLLADAVEQAGFHGEVRELQHARQEVARRAFGMDDRRFHRDLHLRALFPEVVHNVADQGDAGSRILLHLFVCLHGHGLHGRRKRGERDVARRFDVVGFGIQVDDHLVRGNLDAGRLDHGIPAHDQVVPHEFVRIRGRVEAFREFHDFFKIRGVEQAAGNGFAGSREGALSERLRRIQQQKQGDGGADNVCS